MKLKSRILISNTITIALCLIMLLFVFNLVTETFRKNYVSEIIENGPSETPGFNRPGERPRQDISLVIKQKEMEDFSLIATICLFISVLFISFVSQVFTKKIFNRIMNPVDKLIEANERIKKGDFENKVKYAGEYEFEQLCESFNDMQDTLKKEKEREEKWQKTKQDMISGISHDLKTPLTSIKGYVKGIKDGVANTKEKQEQYLDVVYKKACEMDELIEKLLYFSRVENGQINYDIKNISIKKLIEQYIKEHEFDLNEKGAIIEKELLTDIKVKVDIAQIYRVFDNIIQNSIKYSQSKDLKINIKSYEEDNNIKIEIKDNGVGINEENLEKIFEEFYRADESRTHNNIYGNGIGLYVCKYIIEKHKGTIIAENDNGLKMIITLPKGD